MTGEDIRQVREALGLSVPDFASLLGVHLTSAYRWERAGSEEIRLYPFQAQYVARLQAALQKLETDRKRKEWAKSVAQALLVGGTFGALAVVIADAVSAAGKKKAKKKKRP